MAKMVIKCLIEKLPKHFSLRIVCCNSLVDIVAFSKQGFNHLQQKHVTSIVLPFLRSTMAKNETVEQKDYSVTASRAGVTVSAY